MNYIQLVIGGIIFLIIYISPIFCVYKIADFKNRNKTMWTIFALLASMVYDMIYETTTLSIFTFLVPYFSFIILYLLPSRQPAEKMEAYVSKFTKEYDRLGYILFLIISILFVGYMYSHLPILPPTLQSYWLHIHIPLGLIAYSSILTTFILSIVRLLKTTLFLRVVIRLQLISIIAFYACVLFGAFCANRVWGTYWSWDPKETWSLILISVMIICTTYLTMSVPNKYKSFIVHILQLVAVIFYYFIDKITPGLHHFPVEG